MGDMIWSEALIRCVAQAAFALDAGGDADLVCEALKEAHDAARDNDVPAIVAATAKCETAMFRVAPSVPPALLS